MTVNDKDIALSDKGAKILDYLESGKWPSHVTEIKKTKYPIRAYSNGLAIGETQWYGGSAKIRYVYTGFIARRTKDGKDSELHFRIYHPSGQFYRTEMLRKILDFSEEYGLGLIEVIGQTGGMIISMNPEKADEAIDAIRNLGTDVGDTGDTYRDFASCVGPALCEYSLYDTLQARDHYMTYEPIYNNLSNQLFPFKVKLKFSGCPMDCARASHRADFGFIGTWEGSPDVDLDLLQEKTKKEDLKIERLIKECPSGAISENRESGGIRIDPEKCKKSMNCIRHAFPAIKPGKNRKVALLAGGNIKERFGPKMGKPVSILDDYAQAQEFIMKIISIWEDGFPHKDRIGDMLFKSGFSKTVEAVSSSLPTKIEGHPTGQQRIIASAVLTDAEREGYSKWVDKIAKDYGE